MLEEQQLDPHPAPAPRPHPRPDKIYGKGVSDTGQQAVKMLITGRWMRGVYSLPAPLPADKFLGPSTKEGTKPGRPTEDGGETGAQGGQSTETSPEGAGKKPQHPPQEKAPPRGSPWGRSGLQGTWGDSRLWTFPITVVVVVVGRNYMFVKSN